MIFNTPYDTTSGRVYPTDSIAHAIEVCMVKESVDQISLGVKERGFYKSFFLTGLYSSEQEVPLFTHPLLFQRKDRHYLVSDLRLFIDARGADRSNIGNFARNKVEFNFAKARNVLTLAWNSGDMGQIKNGLRFAREVYASFIAQTIARSCYLDPGDQQKIQILANYYYNLMFHDAKVVDEHIYSSWVSHTIENTKASAKQVEEIFAQVQNMENIEQFCATVVKVCQNTRLSDFNHLALITLVKNAWFGVNAKDIISAAIEHPPTWAAMVYNSLVERTFNKSKLADVVKAVDRRGAGSEFLRSFEDIISLYIKDPSALEQFDIRPPISVGSQVKPFSLGA